MTHQSRVFDQFIKGDRLPGCFWLFYIVINGNKFFNIYQMAKAPYSALKCLRSKFSIPNKENCGPCFLYRRL